LRRGKAIIVNLLFAATLSATAAPATEALPFLVAERTTQTPGIDGQLTDACWERAEQTNPFVNIGGSKAPVETYGKLCWDDKNLYVGIVCGEPEMEKVKERLRRSLFNTMEESIEIFIDSDHDQFTYLQFRVGIRGERDTHRGNDLDPRLTSQWLGAAGIEDDSGSCDPFARPEGRNPNDATPVEPYDLGNEPEPAALPADRWDVDLLVRYQRGLSLSAPVWEADLHGLRGMAVRILQTLCADLPGKNSATFHAVPSTPTVRRRPRRNTEGNPQRLADIAPPGKVGHSGETRCSPRPRRIGGRRLRGSSCRPAPPYHRERVPVRGCFHP